MMRWLYVNGADTRDEDVSYWFPVYVAANHGRLEICKWLYDHGAAGDIKRRTSIGDSPLRISFVFSNQRDLSQWLILNGVLCKDDESGKLDFGTALQDLGVRYGRNSYSFPERKALLEWANDLHGARTSFLLFLTGTLSGPKHAHSSRRTVPPLHFLGGNPGIRELIGDYVGLVRGREARIVRQLTEMLPDLLSSY